MSIGPNCRGSYHLRRVYGDAQVKSIFDWQVTPTDTIHAYLDTDFRGLFELSDLEIRDGVVWNARFGTSHMHEFPAALGAENLERHYAKARGRHDHLCDRTRKALLGRATMLLVYSRATAPGDIEGLATHLRAYSPRLRFHLIAETDECRDGTEWPPVHAWRGSSAAWDSLFASYRVNRLRKLALRLKRSTKTARERNAAT